MKNEIEDSLVQLRKVIELYDSMKNEIEDSLAQLRKAIELYDSLISTVTGCSDGGCMIRTPRGMHTNGGCRCHLDGMKTQRVLYAAKQLRGALGVAIKSGNDDETPTR